MTLFTLPYFYCRCVCVFGLQECKFQMLREWKRVTRYRATADELKEALFRAGRKNLHELFDNR